GARTAPAVPAYHRRPVRRRAGPAGAGPPAGRAEGGKTAVSGPNGYSGMPKLRTEIPGFDLIALGGLPAGLSTLVSGTSWGVDFERLEAAGMHIGQPFRPITGILSGQFALRAPPEGDG